VTDIYAGISNEVFDAFSGLLKMVGDPIGSGANDFKLEFLVGTLCFVLLARWHC